MIKEIITAFGGLAEMSRKIGIPKTTIQSWKTKDKIPVWRIYSIKRAARKHKIDLSAFDFVNKSNSNA